MRRNLPYKLPTGDPPVFLNYYNALWDQEPQKEGKVRARPAITLDFVLWSCRNCLHVYVVNIKAFKIMYLKRIYVFI